MGLIGVTQWSSTKKPDPDLTYDLTQNDERSDDLTLVVVWITVAPILKPPTPSGHRRRHPRPTADGARQ